MAPPTRMDTFWARAWAPVDGASLAAFRVFTGALLAISAIRFLAFGWVDRLFVAPTYFFPFWGFEWIRPLPGPWMHAVFVAIAITGVLMALGLFYRVASIVAFGLFTYVELIDVTNYLNHYYLVSLVLFLAMLLPLHRMWSLDAHRDPAVRSETQPAWAVWLLRFQIGLVYLFAALAKATPDWLVHAQPLQIWLAARSDLPAVGSLFERVEVAYLMSWAGFAYDLTIPLWLGWSRTRAAAFVVLVAFHGMTQLLFPIGMFPAIMTTAALVFFDPSWPRTLVRIPAPEQPPFVPPSLTPLRAVATIALAAWCTFHLLMPLRAHAYGGNVLWHEQGMRWSWRVMCREKNGSVAYRVRAREWSRERYVAASSYLTTDQEREFATQPDLVLRLAHHVRDDLERRGLHDVEVRVDALASLNGRPMARLIDADVDLARVEDSLLPAAWLLPAPDGPPPRTSLDALAGR
jgi:vitamin K-dependent gamma-carboxylase